MLFCVAGGLALAVDIGILYLVKPVLGLYGGRACSFLCAATFTWWFNRTLTFQRRVGVSIAAEYLVYLSSMAVGGAINYFVYALSMNLAPMIRSEPAWGVALGSLAGLAFNYSAAKWIIQRKP